MWSHPHHHSAVPSLVSALDSPCSSRSLLTTALNYFWEIALTFTQVTFFASLGSVWLLISCAQNRYLCIWVHLWHFTWCYASPSSLAHSLTNWEKEWRTEGTERVVATYSVQQSNRSLAEAQLRTSYRLIAEEKETKFSKWAARHPRKWSHIRVGSPKHRHTLLPPQHRPPCH